MSRLERYRQRPGMDAVLRAFDGQPYGVVGPRPVVRDRRHLGGWSWSGDEVTALTLHYLVGRKRDEVLVETNIYSKRTLESVQNLVVIVVLRSLWASRPLRKFPLDIRVERQKLTLPVDGKESEFLAYSAGS